MHQWQKLIVNMGLNNLHEFLDAASKVAHVFVVWIKERFPVKVIHDAVGPLTDLASPLFEDERGAGSRSGVRSVDNEATAATEFPLCVLVLSWQFWRSDEM